MTALGFRFEPARDGDHLYEAKPYHGPVERIRLGHIAKASDNSSRNRIAALPFLEAVLVEGRYDVAHADMFDRWAETINGIASAEGGIRFIAQVNRSGSRKTAHGVVEQADMFVIGDAVAIHKALTTVFPFVSILGIPDDFERIFGRSLPHAETLGRLRRDNPVPNQEGQSAEVVIS